MNTIVLKKNIGLKKYQMAVRVLEAMGIEVEKIDYQDKTEMSKKEFFEMIDKSRKSEKKPLTKELRKELFEL